MMTKKSSAKKKNKLSKVTKKTKNVEQSKITNVELLSTVSTVSKTEPKKSESNKVWNTKLVSWNINGLRAWLKNSSSLKYLKEEQPDVIGLQEIKCSDSDIPKEATIAGLTVNWSAAEKAGYAGTGVYSKLAPISVTYGIGKQDHDEEGRVITAEYEKFFFVTAYVPNSGQGLPRLPYRQKSWDPDFTSYLAKLDKKKPIIVCGDLNVAHLEHDLTNPKTNKKTAGFTQEERDGFTKLLKTVDLVDTFRHLYPDKKDAFSFWSYRGNCRGKNIGWRLDYFLISRRLLPNLCDNQIHSSVMGSDHCPIVLYMNL